MRSDYDTYADKVELAKGLLVGLSANFEAPHHKPRELAAKALDLASAFYDELDARELAHEAQAQAEEAAGDTEPPPADAEGPSPAEPKADRPWNGGELDRAG